jgi:homoserine trans-succinylase
MYLRAERFLSGGEMVGEFKAPDESLLNLEGSGFTAMEVIPVPNEHKPAFDRLVELLEFDDHVCEAAPYATVSFVVAYWRKANHVHAWFVQNVQDGADDCRPYDVARSQLKELNVACLRVLAAAKEGEHRPMASEHLPTQEGFFFGSTDYDDWYLENLENTVRQIDHALSLESEWNFIYQSSW